LLHRRVPLNWRTVLRRSLHLRRMSRMHGWNVTRMMLLRLLLLMEPHFVLLHLVHVLVVPGIVGHSLLLHFANVLAEAVDVVRRQFHLLLGRVTWWHWMTRLAWMNLRTTVMMRRGGWVSRMRLPRVTWLPRVVLGSCCWVHVLRGYVVTLRTWLSLILWVSVHLTCSIVHWWNCCWVRTRWWLV